MYVIQAESAGFKHGNKASIHINDLQVEFEKNNGHYRGLHIAVINPENGKTIFA